ncbi:MAG: rhomboid family intramembrane serine protease [Pseudomonadota bacterium]
MFFPYRVDLELKIFPLVTTLICTACIYIHYSQVVSNRAVLQAAAEHCQKTSPFFEMILSTLQTGPEVLDCRNFLLEVHTSTDTRSRLRQLTESSRGLSAFSEEDSRAMVTDMLQQQYDNFSRLAPDYLTKTLWYDPISWNPLNMITAVFAHADWLHLFGNLFFFFAFAAAVELIVGPITFSVLVMVTALFTGIMYSASAIATGHPAPTVGLSGVVMAMVALFVFFLPRGKIRCFLVIRTVVIPAWILATWYIGWDLYKLFSDTGESGINLVAHVSGAGFGYLTGLLFFRSRRQEIQEIHYV